ncbi:multisubunit sodium/proton antiporter, MrpF subunit [Lentibacillus persicus]|uniref:Multisubunit sodium/proton antiporter, MrpF subunit n=1 Tax=Lentibacillus persicus TaxID=640948 RepID=A0A1I1TJ37_9BACI|nr:monovalent cation/H+ antiporter complex subunit F [Lentibacillus persicus]SFD56423.1 multisubunit sodium/proton antiporter, MrpF subunit [Lentibacillus persicus]
MNELLNLTEALVTVATHISIAGIGISLILLVFRIVTGPTNADRAVALDASGMNMMGVAALMAVLIPTTRLNDVILLIGILLFIGTIGIAKYLEKGVIIDRNLD